MREILKTAFKILHNYNNKVSYFFISFYFIAMKLNESSFLKVGHAFFAVEFALLIKKLWQQSCYVVDR